MSTAEPEISLDSPLPPAMPAGTATALFCMGRMSGPGELWLQAGARAVRAQRMAGRFWGVVPCRVPAEGGLPVEALTPERSAVLGTIDVVPPRLAPQGLAREPALVAICLAAFNPEPELLRRQLESLRAQSDTRWTCVISDDCSDPAAFEAIESLVGDDDRFLLSRSGRRIGFYRNFERALAMAPPQAGLVALCDQDDLWHPDKLARLRAGLGDAALVYSDMRLVDADGRVLRETLWRGRANNRRSIASMLVANTVTGAATLMRREVADRALPFPDSPGIEFHDHWLALVAMGLGELAYVEEPLYDYVQHRGAILGKVTGERAAPARIRPRAAYFLGYVPGQVRARALLERCGDRIASDRRRALERYLRADRSLVAMAWLALRPLRALLGRTETLGAEWDLIPGLVWVRLAARLGWDPAFPDPPVFEHRRLRRWRGRIS